MAAKRIGLGHITARVLAASVGAYGLCYVWIVALVLLLPRVTALDGVDATIVSTCGSFVVFVVIILRAFAVRAISRLWLEIAVAAVPAAAVTGWMLR